MAHQSQPHVHVRMNARTERMPLSVGLGAAVPPLSLPAEHFAAALLFFLVGCAGLVVIAPDLAFGAFYAPRVVATVHLFTLGWIMLSIFGALCQFLPVAIGRGLRWERLAHVSFALHVVGAASFIIGFVEGRQGLIIGGATSLSSAFVLFAFNLGVTLATVRTRTVTWWALAAATLFIVVTPLYGVLLQLGVIDALGVHRFHVVAVHAHIAIIGVVLLVIVGVAQRLIPMFLLSHGASELPAKISVALLAAGATLLALPIRGMALDAAGGVLAAGGVVAFVIQAVLFFRHRRRRALDPGLRLAAAGMLGLVIATVLAPVALSRGLGDLRLLSTYFVVLLGAIAMFVAGHYYKIVPFLVWYHRFGPLVGKRKVPKVADLFSARAAHASGALLVAGFAVIAVATYMGSPRLAHTAALGCVLGALVEVFVIAGIARRRPQ